MYIKPSYVKLILMTPLIMAALSFLFAVSGSHFVYSLTMLFVLFVAIIYVVDLAGFIGVLIKGQFDRFISRIPYVDMKSWISSLIVLALFYASNGSLAEVSGQIGKALIVVVNIGVVFTFLVKTYKIFVFQKKKYDDFDDENDEF
ncbi:hypothetical protein ACTOJ1_000714 [Shigella flexneri]